MTEEQRAREVLRRYGLHRGDITKRAQMLAALTAFADEARLAEQARCAEIAETYTRVLPPHGGKA